ncbi:hypothetical protein RB597_006887 [Gaeumannomyces tritici]
MASANMANAGPSDRRSSSPPDGTYQQGDDDDEHDEAGRAPAEPADWDLDTDDVRSISSSDLYEARPNRWRGPRSTWRDLTEADRLDHDALVSLRNQDLAVHLYSAFVLRRRRRLAGGRDAAAADGTGEDEDGEEADVDAVTGQRVRSTAWAPPKSWTTWPMRAHAVPTEGLALGPQAPVVDDALEAYTVRPAAAGGGDDDDGAGGPRGVLEELLCAAVLRLAKDRVRRRQERGEIDGGHDGRRRARDGTDAGDAAGPPSLAEEEGEDDEENEWPPGREPPSAQPPLSPPPPPSSDPGRDEASPRPTSRQRAEARRTYAPAVSADDAASYALLRPAAARLVDMLDGVLLRLHDARMRMTHGGASSDEDSSAASGEESSGGGGSRSGGETSSQGGKKGKRRKRGRPRSGIPVMPVEPMPEFGPEGKRRPGRPRKPPGLPLPGESERDMMIRVAREMHRRLPVPSSSDEGKDDDGDDEGDDDDDGGAEGEKKKSAKRSKTPIPQLEGETDYEYRLRVARARHLKRPRPVPVKEEPPLHDAMDVDGSPGGTGERPGGGVQGTQGPDSGTQRRTQTSEKAMARWPLRDWGDVVGAAALAGFPPSAVARAAQRCASLFGQSMDMHTVVEVPAAAGTKRQRTKRDGDSGGGVGDDGFRTATYRPGAALSDTSLSSGSDAASDRGRGRASSRVRMKRLHELSRASSAAPQSPDDDDDAQEQLPRGRRASSSSQPAAAAATTTTTALAALRAAAANACPHLTCPRSVRGFARQAHLVRHLDLVHGEKRRPGRGRGRSSRSASRGRSRGREAAATDGDDDDDDDSADEMDGAIHVDGFLQPIKIRSGWRAKDTQQRVRSTKSVSRGRARGSEERGQ